MSIMHFVLALIAGLCWADLTPLQNLAHAAAYTLIGDLAWGLYYWITRDGQIRLLFAFPAASLISSSMPLHLSFLVGLILALLCALLIGLFVRHQVINKTLKPTNEPMADSELDGANVRPAVGQSF